MTDTHAPTTATVTHRGARLQVHVADWGDGDVVKRRPHLHVQDLAGGAGRIVPLDQEDGAYTDALVRELADEHDTVRHLLGGGADTPADDDQTVDVAGWPQQ